MGRWREYWSRRFGRQAEPVAGRVFDEAAQRLIQQGVPAEKVRRATAMIHRLAELGALPDGIVSEPIPTDLGPNPPTSGEPTPLEDRD